MIIAANRLLSTVVQSQATTSVPNHNVRSSNSETFAPIQNSSDITTKETSLLSTTSLGPGKKNMLFEICFIY